MRGRLRDFIISLFLVALALLAGCRQTPAPTPTTGANTVRVYVAYEPDPPRTGDAVLLVTLTRNGAPLTDAQVAVRGDMTHAGMTPVNADAVGENEAGVYRLPFRWTMGGEWILTVTVMLADGTTFTETVTLEVRS